jgi:polysaccharide export outer membrane protein
MSNFERWGLRFRPHNLVLLCSVLAACAQLPAAAPTSVELENSLKDGAPNYLLVNVDERIADILRQFRRSTFDDRFKNKRYAPSNSLHPGDSVSVSIYELGASPTFGAPGTPAPTAQTAGSLGGVSTSLPPQVIEADGTIMVPFVGRVRAAGKTPAGLGAEIQRQLEGKAVNPQVIVSLVNGGSNTATVGGDVNQPRPVPLTLRGERLLDVIAAAGGAKYPAYDVYASVVRGGHINTVLLQTVVTHPSENIIVRPRDQVFLTRHPRTFAVLGATSKVSQYTFDTARVSLAEGVARAGGPIDTVGNPSGIYLFRYEPAAIAEKILGKETVLSARGSADSSVKAEGDFVGVLYRVDLRKARGYFLAQDIEIQDKDVILVANAEGTQLVKLLTIIRGFTGIAYDLTRQSTVAVR